MSRWPKVLLAVLAAIAVLLILNTVVLDHQTKGAAVTFKGGRIVRLQGGDLQVLDSGPVAYLTVTHRRNAPSPPPPQPIVLLHCYTCALNWWEKLTPLLEKAGHRVIAIDLLGHGGSAKPRSGYSISNQAQLVAEALDRLQIKGPVTVVGHSLGGAVATALAAGSPKLVGRLVIIDSAPDSSYGSLDLLAKATLTPVIGEGLWRVKMDWSIRNGLEQAFAPGYDVPDAFVDDVKRMTYSSYNGSHDGFDSYVGETPLDQRLRRLGVPLLAIFGAEDQIVDARPALSAYAGVPGAQTALVQDSGHSPGVEKPVKTARLIERFERSP